MSRLWKLLALFAAILAIVPPAIAQQPIQYIYDDLGRLVGVVDPAADTVVYSYDAVGNLLSIARFASSIVSVIAFSPGSGPVGATVTISGTGFSATPSQNAVTVNGTAATVTASTATQLVVTVPSGATTGAIAVTSPSGSATSAASFTVTTSGPPTITSFTPAVGVAGDPVTITGTNYEATLTNNKVAFNDTRPVYGTVAAVTSSTLSVAVPPGGTSGRVSVATPAGKAVSTSDFFIPPMPYTAASVVFTGRIAVDGSSVTVTIPTASKIGMVVFDAVAGQRLSLGGSVMTMSHTVYVYRPDGTVLTSQNVPFPSWAIDMNPVPVTGTYTIVVAPNGSATGNITLTLSQEVTGSLSVGGAALPLSISRPGQRARITFTGTAGQRLDLGLTGSTLSSAVASVLKPDGTVHGAAQTFGTGDNALDTLPALPVSGTYTILIDPNNANTGNVTLTLSEEVAGTITVDGAAVPVTIGRAGQQARVTFAGTAGQRLGLGLTSTTISSGFATLYNPNGSTLASVFFGTGNTAVDTPVLASTGTYEILIDPSGGATGNVTLTLSTEVTGTLTIDGGASPITISRAGQRARLTFSGTAGNRVSVNLTGGTITSGTAILLNPDGSTLASQGFFSGTSAFIEPKTTATTGTYALLIDPNAAFTGTITVALYNVPADVTGTLTVNGGAQTVTTTAPGQKAVLTFTWNAGQQVTVQGANSTQGCITLFVKRPDNATVSISPCTATYSVSTTSPTAGTFTVTVDPNGTNTGSVDLSVTNP
jgi:YD repeat-containing protein